MRKSFCLSVMWMTLVYIINVTPLQVSRYVHGTFIIISGLLGVYLYMEKISDYSFVKSEKKTLLEFLSPYYMEDMFLIIVFTEQLILTFLYPLQLKLVILFMSLLVVYFFGLLCISLMWLFLKFLWMKGFFWTEE